MRHKEVEAYPRVALVLQGGGALGSYQAGVVQGLYEVGIHPNWVAGISIGALNCALMAGNAPKDRVTKLKAFWETICRPPSLAATAMSSLFDVFGPAAHALRSYTEQQTERMFGSFAATQTMLEGQPGFFTPRPLAPGGGGPTSTSYYEMTPLIATLEKFVDFDRINSKEMRVSVGATNVSTGNFVYFDNTEIKLHPEHFVASGALPPGFAAVEIDGEFYWDGGCVSNTPLEQVLNVKPREDTLIFQVDLWSARGKLPTDIFEVLERQKDIQYSSRTRGVTNQVNDIQQLRQQLWDALARIPKSVKAKDPWFDALAERIYGARYNCIQLIYKNKPSEGHYKDSEFSHETMSYHWQTGLSDMRRTLENADCLSLPPPGENFVTDDVHRHQ
jgi:NTE family protein